MGRDYYEPLIDFLERMVIEKTISPEDLNLFLVTDSIDEAMAHIEKHAIQKFGLVRRREMKKRWWLGE
jgi:predicted Rossmann-fold nucleotide-binding protein